MEQSGIENFIESQYRYFFEDIQENHEYEFLYSEIAHLKIRRIFYTAHYELVNLLKLMNDRLPTEEEGKHYWADPSRKLLKIIDIILTLQANLKLTQYAFYVDYYYGKLFEDFKSWLATSGGSTIPPHRKQINIYYTLPIFLAARTIIVDSVLNNACASYQLKLIGEGSYAKVFKYKDLFYNQWVALKRANSGLGAKELVRFRKEFDTMNGLHSPYVTQVYRFFDDKNEYTMEYMDYTLKDYISKGNNKITIDDRKKLVYQIFKAFGYLHSKNILHRDISPNNILIRIYDDVNIVKISDFGLAHVKESELTTVNTEFKGWFNDPSLLTDGFASYDMCHEVFALTRIVYYTITGRINTEKIENESLSDFVRKGLNTDKSIRFKDIEDMRNAFRKLDF